MIESTLFGELKQPCCEINPDVSVKMSDVSEHSEFDYPKKKEEKKKEKRGKRWSYNKMLIDCFHDPIMQYVLGVLYIKTIQFIYPWDCIMLQ